MAQTSDRVYRIKRKEDPEKHGLTTSVDTGDVHDAEVAEDEEIVEQDS